SLEGTGGCKGLRLNDSPQLRGVSITNAPNLPLDFNLENSDSKATISTRSATPVNILLQLPQFLTQIITTNDTTQPFNVNDDTND
ncbi:unnamed protein product, partial [Didymodactylos carnosus]